MSKYDRDSADICAVKRLGDEIGFGHLMAIAHEVWARELEEKGLPREGAFCAVGYSRIKDEYQADAMNDPIYKVIVERALADTPHTEEICDTCIYQSSNVFGNWCVGRNTCDRYEADTPQTDGYMTVEQAEDYRKMLDKAEHKVYGNIADTPQTEDAYERGVKHAWEVAQKVFDSTVTFYEAEDVAKQMTDCSKCETYWNCQGQCDEIPQIEDDAPQPDCGTCKHDSEPWDSEACDGCSKAHSNYEPTDCPWK